MSQLGAHSDKEQQEGLGLDCRPLKHAKGGNNLKFDVIGRGRLYFGVARPKQAHQSHLELVQTSDCEIGTISQNLRSFPHKISVMLIELFLDKFDEEFQN